MIATFLGSFGASFVLVSLPSLRQFSFRMIATFFGSFGSQHHPQHRTVDCHDERVVLVDNMLLEFDFLHSVTSVFPFFYNS